MVVVDSVDVLSVALVSVEEDPVELELDESGVVVVIVLMIVLPLVVIVVTNVVVACAANGAAPAVHAAVVAPSVIRTANAAPHAACLRYFLIPPPFWI